MTANAVRSNGEWSAKSHPRIGYAVYLGSFAIGMTFLRGASSHINNPYAFLHSVFNYHLLPAWIGVLVAVFLPVLQLVLGMVHLFWVKLWRSAFSISTVVFLALLLAQSLAYSRGLNIPCGCFGPAVDSPIGLRTMLIPLAGLLISVSCLLALRTSDSPHLCTTQRGDSMTADLSSQSLVVQPK